MTKQNLPARDGLENVMTGLGTASSKNYHSQFKLDAFNDYMQLEAAYQSNWLARQIVDIPADDMVREWRAIKCQDAEQIRIEEDRHDLQQTVNEALSWGRLYGGAAVLMLTNQDLEKPLNVNQVKKGDLERLIVFDRYELMPLSINNWNPLAKNYLMPEYYTVYQGNQRIHWTHFARFMGAKLPRRQRQVTMGWGDSELRKCLSDLKLTVASYEGISELMQEANLDVITREGLADDLTTDQEEKITERYALYNMMKSLFKLSLLDGEEKLDRMTLNLSGVAPVLQTQMSWITGASRIPEVKFFGKSLSGLNSTGDGELKTYYDDIKSWQVSQLEPPLSVLDQVLVRSAIGRMPSDYNWEWNRLYQPNRKEEAEASKTEAETDIMLLDAGIIQRSQVQRRLQSAEAYQFDDEQIEELEALEDSNLFDRDEPEETADE